MDIWVPGLLEKKGSNPGRAKPMTPISAGVGSVAGANKHKINIIERAGSAEIDAGPIG